MRTGPSPRIQHFVREPDEAQFVVDTVKEWSKVVGENAICIAARTDSQLQHRYVPLLENAGFKVVHVEKDPESESQKPGVRVATMHRLKGLEFSRILLVGVQEGLVPLGHGADPTDFESRARHELQERCLFYVAATRARDELAITGYGAPSPFAKTMS